MPPLNSQRGSTRLPNAPTADLNPYLERIAAYPTPLKHELKIATDRFAKDIYRIAQKFKDDVDGVELFKTIGFYQTIPPQKVRLPSSNIWNFYLREFYRKRALNGEEIPTDCDGLAELNQEAAQRFKSEDKAALRQQMAKEPFTTGQVPSVLSVDARKQERKRSVKRFAKALDSWVSGLLVPLDQLCLL